MKAAAVQRYFLSKPEAVEDYPFGPDVTVFKVMGKMFGTLATENGVYRTNLKCDPLEAVQLRDVFDAVLPGYHMNKKHWNTVMLDGSLPNGEIERMIEQSYGLVVKSLKKADRNRLELHYDSKALYGN